MFSKAYDSEKKHIDRWNLASHRKASCERHNKIGGEKLFRRSYTVKGILLNDYVIDVSSVKT
jgi:hypothetical protein